MVKSATVIVSWWAYGKPKLYELNNFLDQNYVIKSTQIVSERSPHKESGYDQILTTVVYVLEKTLG